MSEEPTLSLAGDSVVAVVIPAYKVTRHVEAVIATIPAWVQRIYVIDDACPDGSGRLVEASVVDPRVTVIYHEENRGVGGAVMSGYMAAIRDGADVMVKIDGDGQMDPSLIANFINPILLGEADYTKGNRFFDLESIRSMPKLRLFGNAVLSFLTKISSGYWNIFDPTNGYTAIHREVAAMLPFDKISSRYFFETDILFRLNTVRAVVTDIPMTAKYADEVSNLKISRIVGDFLLKHLRNFGKRIFYNYYLRDLSLASIELPVGMALFAWGIVYGVMHWAESATLGVSTPAGTVMLSALPIILGGQLILAFLAYDIASVPRRPWRRRRFPSASTLA